MNRWDAVAAVMLGLLLGSPPEAWAGEPLLPGEQFAVGINPESVTLADLDGDLVLDVVTSHFDSNEVGVLLGNGDGTFAAATAFAVANGPYSLALADLDGDLFLDIVGVSGNVSVLLGNGDGTFAATRAFAAAIFPASVAIADLDGDLVLDVVTANTSTASDISVLLGKGAAQPQPSVVPLLSTPIAGLLALTLFALSFKATRRGGWPGRRALT